MQNKFVVMENDFGVKVESNIIDQKYIKVLDPKDYPQIEISYGDKVKVLDTHANLEWLLNQFNASLKYNMMTHDREIVLPGHQFSLENSDNNSLHHIKYLATLNKFPSIKNIDDHLTYLAHKKPYHPIRECIQNNPWDGIGRVDDFIKTIKSPHPLLNKVLKTWMCMAIAAAFSEKGFVCHGVLVLLGYQGRGKTEWIKRLNPLDNQNAVRAGATLDTFNKDSIYQLSQYWISELGEVNGTINKNNAAKLKNYITLEYDILRLVYDRKPSKIYRRSAFAASVNNLEYLVDETGNRRWWSIVVEDINYEHNFDMKQVWAEIYHIWQNGHLTYLKKEDQDIIDDVNKIHEQIDPIKEKLLSFYDWNTPDRRYLTVTTILEEIGYINPKKSDSNKAATYLREINNISMAEFSKQRTKYGRLHAVPRRRFPDRYS